MSVEDRLGDVLGDAREIARRHDVSITSIPAGLWVRRGTRADDVEPIAPEDDAVVVLVGAPGEVDGRFPPAKAVAALLAALPERVRPEVVLVPAERWPGGRHFAADVADALGEPVRARHAGGSRSAVDSAPGAVPFVAESQYRPGEAPVVLRWTGPLPDLVPAASPGSYELAAGWLVQLTADGMIACPADARIRPAALVQAPDARHLRFVVAGAHVPVPVTEAVTALVERLPEAVRARVRVYAVPPAIEAPTIPESPFAPPTDPARPAQTAQTAPAAGPGLRRVRRDGPARPAARSLDAFGAEQITLRSMRAPEPAKKWASATGFVTVADGTSVRSANSEPDSDLEPATDEPPEAERSDDQ